MPSGAARPACCRQNFDELHGARDRLTRRRESGPAPAAARRLRPVRKEPLMSSKQLSLLALATASLVLSACAGSEPGGGSPGTAGMSGSAGTTGGGGSAG